MFTLINDSSGGTLQRPTIMCYTPADYNIYIIPARYSPLYNLSGLAFGRDLTPCRNRFYNILNVIWYLHFTHDHTVINSNERFSKQFVFPVIAVTVYPTAL